MHIKRELIGYSLILFAAGVAIGIGLMQINDISFRATLANEDCTDEIDNDGDGLIDCSDTDCEFDESCYSYEDPPPSDPEDCTDEIDNDGDGLIDCSDTDCEFDPSCYGDPYYP
jgi:hypothetical protein